MVMDSLTQLNNPDKTLDMAKASHNSEAFVVSYFAKN